VLFLDKRPVSEKATTKHLWIYDPRTNRRFTLKERPMVRADLDDFVAGYAAGDRRKESERFRRYAYADLVARDRVNLDIFWLKDDALDDPDLFAAAGGSRRRRSWRTWRPRWSASAVRRTRPARRRRKTRHSLTMHRIIAY
jgi:hypothetical protein